MKVDVDRGQKMLLDLDRLDFPCVIETQGWETTNRFIGKFGMKIIDSPPLFFRGRLYTLANMGGGSDI